MKTCYLFTYTLDIFDLEEGGHSQPFILEKCPPFWVKTPQVSGLRDACVSK